MCVTGGCLLYIAKESDKPNATHIHEIVKGEVVTKWYELRLQLNIPDYELKQTYHPEIILHDLNLTENSDKLITDLDNNDQKTLAETIIYKILSCM